MEGREQITTAISSSKKIFVIRSIGGVSLDTYRKSKMLLLFAALYIYIYIYRLSYFHYNKGFTGTGTEVNWISALVLSYSTLPSFWMSVWMDVFNAPIDTTPLSNRRKIRRPDRVRPSETNGRVGFRPDSLQRPETRLWRPEIRCVGMFVQLAEYADVTCAHATVRHPLIPRVQDATAPVAVSPLTGPVHLLFWILRPNTGSERFLTNGIRAVC